MALISSELMERTWQRVGSLDGRKILRLQKAHRKSQNALILFVYRALPDFREEAGGVLIYVFHVVLEAFQHAQPRPKRIGIREIEERLAHLESAFQSGSAATFQTSEPHAYRYVLEALTEADDVELTPEEIDSFQRSLWVAIECLHSACRLR